MSILGKSTYCSFKYNYQFSLLSPNGLEKKDLYIKVTEGFDMAQQPGFAMGDLQEVPKEDGR
jgi:hypothetical protein